MDNLNIDATSSTPLVSFDGTMGNLLIKGYSTTEYPFEFYERLTEWVEDYGQGAKDATRIVVGLEYCNTASSKCLLNFLKKAIEVLDGKEIIITWEYDKEDEDALDTGKDFARLLKIPFEFEGI
ncbi:MAG: DUF1987 domain-containing protein [Flavobacteriales bacterium]|nr:DUF1987 domain-containing protein [Flavobacteriales bacterium]